MPSWLEHIVPLRIRCRKPWFHLLAEYRLVRFDGDLFAIRQINDRTFLAIAGQDFAGALENEWTDPNIFVDIRHWRVHEVSALAATVHVGIGK